MLLLDLSGIVVKSCINLHHELRDQVQLKTFRHVAFSTVLHYKKKFSKQYGKPVICMDMKPYWRTAIFPHYKQNRKDSREKSKVDWKAFGENMSQIQSDMVDYLPYPVIDVPRVEADDSISVLTQYACQHRDPVMIVSSDKDMIQLQERFKNVNQFSPAVKRLLTPKDSEYTLLSHIIKGDSSDGIPNIYSPDDIFMPVRQGERQTPVYQKTLDEAASFDDALEWAEEEGEEEFKKFRRNQLLIDTSLIPDRLQSRIIAKYEHLRDNPKPNRMKEFIVKHRLRNLLDEIRGF